MPSTVTPQLMFEGVAEAAMALYISVFRGAEIRRIDRYGPGEVGAAGTVKRATFALGGREFHCIDSPVPHQFTFTPAISLFVECESEAELDEAFRRLSDGGRVLMPLGSYGFSTKFGWVDDRFGVSWQWNWA